MSDATGTADAPVAELPGDGLREGIVDELRRQIGDALVDHVLKPQDDLWIRVRPDAWEATGRALRAMGFEYFCFLSAIDWMPSPYGRGEDDPTEPPPERSTEIKQGYAGGETRFQVFARVTDVRRHVGVTVKADVPDEAPSIASWHAVYLGANWHERETHEMFGISFDGHPDLRNMYLPTEFEGHPLRKDFPLLARHVKPWPGIVDVEPMPATPDDQDGDGLPDQAAEAPAAPDQAAAPAETAETPAAPADGAPAPAATEPTPETAPEAAPLPEAAEAPEQAADPADATAETTEDAPDHEAAPAPEVADTAAPADEAQPADAGTTDTESTEAEGSARPEALVESDLATDTESTDPATDTTPEEAADETPAADEPGGDDTSEEARGD